MTAYYAMIAQADGGSLVISPIWYTRRIIMCSTLRAEELALAVVFPNPTAGTATLSYFLLDSLTPFRSQHTIWFRLVQTTRISINYFSNIIQDINNYGKYTLLYSTS